MVASFFARESRTYSRKYVFGLILPIERKNVENIAKQVAGAVRRLQEFFSDSLWNDEGCIEELPRLVGEELGATDEVLILDDTGFPKEWTWSAVMGRQCSGNVGADRQLPGGCLPGLREQPGPHAGRPTAVHAGAAVCADRDVRARRARYGAGGHWLQRPQSSWAWRCPSALAQVRL